MTRSERRKKNFEEFKQKELKNKQIVVTLMTMIKYCKDCHLNEETIVYKDEYETIKKMICKKKCRKTITDKDRKFGVSFCEIQGKIPYLNCDCENICLMHFEEENNEMM